MKRVLVDTGPLVAFLNRRDAHHAWVTEQFARLRPPLLVCEPVLSEACFLVRALPGGAQAVLDLVQVGVVKLAFDLQHELTPVSRLLGKYASVPMSLADACLVRMSELHADCELMTIDTDFQLYRRNGRQMIRLISPGDGE